MSTQLRTLVLERSWVRRLQEKNTSRFPLAEDLEKYFREYSTSAKAHRTKDISNSFFREVAKFLLEVGCVHINAYGMPKQKACIVIDTFKGCAMDWGVITGPALREGLHAFQAGKKLRPIIQQYLIVLFPPRGLLASDTRRPMHPPWSAKWPLADLATTEWEEEPNLSTIEESP